MQYGEYQLTHIHTLKLSKHCTCIFFCFLYIPLWSWSVSAYWGSCRICISAYLFIPHLPICFGSDWKWNINGRVKTKERNKWVLVVLTVRAKVFARYTELDVCSEISLKFSFIYGANKQLCSSWHQGTDSNTTLDHREVAHIIAYCLYKHNNGVWNRLQLVDAITTPLWGHKGNGVHWWIFFFF